MSAHDAESYPSADPSEMSAVIEQLGGLGPRLTHIDCDLADAAASRRVIKHTVDRFGAIDVLIVNHTHSVQGSLVELTSGDLDRAWAVNARGRIAGPG